MKKILVAALAIALTATVAFAQSGQVNTYKVTGAVSPSKAGTKKKPVPVGVTFDYQVGEQHGWRPSPVKEYSIEFDGLKTNGKYFKSCTAAAINNAGSNAVCSKAAAVGTGQIHNLSGPSNDPQDPSKQLTCYLDLTVYNAGQNKAALYLKGGPNDPRGAAFSCPLQVSQAIDASYVQTSKGQALDFVVNPTLLHPLGPSGGVDNAVVNVTSKIKKLVAHVKGKSIGYYSSVGGCVKHKRGITVTFTGENGQVSKASTSLRCS